MKCISPFRFFSVSAYMPNNKFPKYILNCILLYINCVDIWKVLEERLALCECITINGREYMAIYQNVNFANTV